MAKIDLVTLGFVREMLSGNSIVTLTAAPALASFGEEENALLEARMYLTEYLAQADPEIVARFALPPETRLHKTDVVIPRDDLPRRWNVTDKIQITSLIIPTLPNTKGVRDSWVMVIPLLHTFYVLAAEDLDEAIESEVKRIVAAREMTPLEYLELLPFRDERVVRLEVSIDRQQGAAEVEKGANLRKRIAEFEARRHAVAILESVAEPMHAGLSVGRQEPRPFPLRDKELALLRSMLAVNPNKGGVASERSSTLLIGKERVGKSGLFRAWLEREYELNRPRFVFATSGARLIAGMSGFGQWQERVKRVMDAAQLIDAILYFDDLSDLFSDRPGGHVDIPSALRPYLEDGRVRMVAEIREDTLERVEAQNGGFFACFGRVRLEPFDAKQSLTVLRQLSQWQAKHEPDRPTLTEEANTTLIELAERYLPYESFPGKAVRLASELRATQEIALGSEAPGAKIGPDVVHESFSIRTGVPTFLLRDDRALAVNDVFKTLRERLIGQDAAVRRVAELVCIVKAGLQPAGKPLATLLFVGPTGVGKTELARALAQLLFGNEDRLVRFDMSEYASAYATERLFRGTDGGEGLLTRKVREQPFCVVLLDEIEKAHPAAFDLLLQVCGEGRLTDGRGKTAYFHNAILIMTSNLGAAHRRGATGFAKTDRKSREQEDDAHYTKVVRETFRPEFVNRIDRIIAFRSLGIEDIREVARIATAKTTRRRGIIERGIDLRVTDDALLHLAEGGLSEVYGARALRRHVERELVTPVGRVISGWGRIDGERIVVAKEEEPPAQGEERGDQHGGLRFGVVRVPARRSNNAAYALDAITKIRRETHRHLRLERIVQLKDHVDYLVAQLGYGNTRRKKKNEPALDGQEVAQMAGEHSRLASLYEKLTTAFGEICAIEELALVGFMNGEALDTLKFEAEEARKRFRETLVYTLVAQEAKKNAATLMIKELDGRRAFDKWLVPLLSDLERRKWTAEVHIDGDKGPPVAGTTWSANRRWGPPRTPREAIDMLMKNDRTFRNVMLCIDGDHAGIWLALECGRHKFSPFQSSSEPANLHVSLVATRSRLTDGEWTPPGLDPPNAQVADELAHEPPLRSHDATKEAVVLLDDRVTVPIGLKEYWPRFEEIALEHLLLYERPEFEASLDRDVQFRPLLDDSFAEVRDLVRRGEKINAIKKYRELTGSSLLEAKNAVDAM